VAGDKKRRYRDGSSALILAALARLLLTALSGLLALLARLLLAAAALLSALSGLLVLLTRILLTALAGLLFVRIHDCSLLLSPGDNKPMPARFRLVRKRTNARA
jgi:fatty acid desaturase